MSLQLTKILTTVSNFYEIPAELIKSKTRKDYIVHARQVYMYLAKKYTKHSLAKISGVCNRDHATAIHAIKVVSDQIYINFEIMAEIEEIEQNLINPLVVQDINLLQLSKNHTLSYVG
jgi:chromosomal replication initiator protein